MTLLNKRLAYKPFKYDWAYEAFLTQNRIHWMAEEVPMAEDVRDWNYRLTEEEKSFLTQIFRFFTQADCDVANGYIHHFMPKFSGNPEVAMMLTSFAAMEGTHINAYATLIDTIGMPEAEYIKFLEYEEMLNKHEYVEKFKMSTPKDIAKSLAVYAAFTEGLQLFSSFIMLLNFSRYGKMKGMGQIVTWSVRDESHHCDSMIKLFRTFIQENIEIWTDEFKKELYDIAREMVKLEFAFIDLAFESGGIKGLDKEEVKEYVKYIADRRLLQLGLKPNFGVKDNPLPWVDEILNLTEHANFFETRATEYSKGSITGDWSKVWA